MSIDFRPLNRQQCYDTQQKASLKKIFSAAEAAARSGDSTKVDPITIHLAMGGWFSGDDKHDMQNLFKIVRSAIDEGDSSRSIDSPIGAFRAGGRQRTIIRAMTEAVLEQIT